MIAAVLGSVFLTSGELARRLKRSRVPSAVSNSLLFQDIASRRAGPLNRLMSLDETYRRLLTGVEATNQATSFV